LQVVLSFLRRSCCTEPWFLIPVMPSSFTQCLFLNVYPLGIPLATLSWLCSWRLCPLCHATPAWRVISLQAAANFFQDPPSPLILFFGFLQCPTARCQSPCLQICGLHLL
jgi:hypothetical protein